MLSLPHHSGLNSRQNGICSIAPKMASFHQSENITIVL